MRGLSGVLDQREVLMAALNLEPPGEQNRLVVARLYGGSAWAAAAPATCARQVRTRSDEDPAFPASALGLSQRHRAARDAPAGPTR